jgi:D-alanyl-D-alanine-carboxypeptidase/D-alanyl-D-alanine-endopeptidase
MSNTGRLFALLLVLFSMNSLFAAPQAPTDDQIRNRLQDFVDSKNQAPGIVVGLVDEKGQRVLAWGKQRKEGAAVDGDTVFEIGSITKVFTALLLQDMVVHGEVSLDDPIGKFLPATIKPPSRNGKQITLLDLATHTAGLPRLPENMSALYLATHGDNPYAAYDAKQLYEFLSDYKLPRDIGAKYEYSNIGFGLLGHLLTLRAGTNYEALLLRRVCQPLGMNDTFITFTPERKARLAPGHSTTGKPVSNWDFSCLAGCGAVRSTANDMLRFLAAGMGLKRSPLADELEKMQAPRHDAGLGQKIGLGWHINADAIVWHNGGTGGYRSYLGFDRPARRGVVVLANSAADVDALGLFILGAARQHTVAQVDSAAFGNYVGKYKLAPSASFTITREGAHLFAQLTGQPRFEVFPESEDRFFYKVVDAQLTFVKDKAGVVTHLVLHQNGLDQEAKKVE